MRRLTIALLLVSACGGAVEATTTSSGADPTPSPPVESTTSTSAGPSPTSSDGVPTTTHPEATTTTSDRQPAPDFTLELGEGGSYTLSEGDKPVFLVFWAEW